MKMSFSKRMLVGFSYACSVWCVTVSTLLSMLRSLPIDIPLCAPIWHETGYEAQKAVVYWPMHLSESVYLTPFELHWSHTDITLELTCFRLLVHCKSGLAGITPKYESNTVALWRNGKEVWAGRVISGSIPANAM